MLTGHSVLIHTYSSYIFTISRRQPKHIFLSFYLEFFGFSLYLNFQNISLATKAHYSFPRFIEYSLIFSGFLFRVTDIIKAMAVQLEWSLSVMAWKCPVFNCCQTRWNTDQRHDVDHVNGCQSLSWCPVLLLSNSKVVN